MVKRDPEVTGSIPATIYHYSLSEEAEVTEKNRGIAVMSAV